MALTTVTRTVDGIDIDFYQTRDDEGTIYGVLVNGLSPLDVTAFNDVDTNGEGADLQAKLDGYTLKTNGQDALDVYGNMIVDVDMYAQAVFRNRVRGNAAKYVAENRRRIEDLEAASPE